MPATAAPTEARIAARNPAGGGALTTSGDTFLSCTAFTVDETPCVTSIGDAPPRSIDR